MSRAEILEFIGGSGTAVLTTIRPDGRPVPLPVWYVAVAESLCFRSPRSARRVRNLETDPRVSVLLHAGERWAQLRGVLIHGTARVVTDSPTLEQVHELFAREFADLVLDPESMPRSVSAHYAEEVVFQVAVPEAPTSWDNRKIRLRA
jgi:PPOX class probable F420-dependent enzyme